MTGPKYLGERVKDIHGIRRVRKAPGRKNVTMKERKREGKRKRGREIETERETDRKRMIPF